MKIKFVGLIAVPVCAMLAGCGGGSGPSPSNPGVTGSVAQGQSFFQKALNAYNSSNDLQNASVTSNLASAIREFQGALARDSSDSSANAGLATALFAQSLAEGSKQPFIGDLVDFSNSQVLGLDSVIALKKSGTRVSDGALVKAVNAPLSTVEALTPVKRGTANLLSTNTIGQVQTYLAGTEIPRLQRIQVALSRISKSPDYGYALYQENGSARKIYGPDFQMIEGFVNLELGVAGTLTGYDLNPGNFYGNLEDLSQFDANHDGRVTPAEYVAPGNFGKLRSGGAGNLQLALTSLRAATTTLEAGITAERSFNAPADAAIQLTASQKDVLGEALTFLTQAKTALAGNASYPISGQTRTVNLPEFFVTPAADLRTILPTLQYQVSGGNSTIVNVIDAQDPTFSGVLPGGSGFLYAGLISNSNAESQIALVSAPGES